VSVRVLDRMAKITSKKEKKADAADNSEYVSRKKFDELKENYDSLLAEFKKCMQALENKNYA